MSRIRNADSCGDWLAGRFAPAPRCARHRGFVLLEVLVAIVLLAVSTVALASLEAHASAAVGRARAADTGVRHASAFLDAVALWPRADLDRRLGERVTGAWRLKVERPTPTLYVVTLTDTAPPRATLLRTALFRPSRTLDTVSGASDSTEHAPGSADPSATSRP